MAEQSTLNRQVGSSNLLGSTMEGVDMLSYRQTALSSTAGGVVLSLANIVGGIIIGGFAGWGLICIGIALFISLGVWWYKEFKNPYESRSDNEE